MNTTLKDHKLKQRAPIRGRNLHRLNKSKKNKILMNGPKRSFKLMKTTILKS